MAGVGDESFLVLHVADERPDSDVAHGRQDEDVEDDTAQAEPEGIAHERRDCGDIARAVQDDDEETTVVIRHDHIGITGPPFLEESLVLPTFPGFGNGRPGVLDGFLFRKRGDMLDIDMLGIAIGIDEDAEKAYLIGEFRRFFRP